MQVDTTLDILSHYAFVRDKVRLSVWKVIIYISIMPVYYLLPFLLDLFLVLLSFHLAGKI